MRSIILTTAFLLTAVPAAIAERFDPAQVPADAKWLAHIDFDAVRDAGLAQKAYDFWLSQDPSRHKLLLSQFRLVFHMDPIEDLKSITVSGCRFEPDTGVAIVRAKMDQRQLLALLGRNPNHRTEAYGKHTIHYWTQDKDKPSEHTATGCFHGPSVAVVGREPSRVKAVLDILDGNSSSLADGDSQLKQKAPPGTAFVARAIDLDEADLPWQSPIVRKTELLALAV